MALSAVGFGCSLMEQKKNKHTSIENGKRFSFFPPTQRQIFFSAIGNPIVKAPLK